MDSGLPRVLLLGRPNTGKSTLFNRLTGRGIALTDASPHTTRDVLAATCEVDGVKFELCDAAGFLDQTSDTLEDAIKHGLETAARQADVIILVLDARAGLLGGDVELASYVRRLHKPVIPVVNKVDGPARDDAAADFFALGFEVEPIPVSAKGGHNARELLTAIAALTRGVAVTHAVPDEAAALKVALVGRPNVGKSTLLNRLAGDERVLVHEAPGTTRDAVDVAVTHDGRRYVFVDTAGIRRRTKSKGPLEEWSLAKAFAAIRRAAVVVLVLDGAEGPTAQDSKIAAYADRYGRALLLFINKTDLLAGGVAAVEEGLERVRRELNFASYAPVLAGSALAGESTDTVYAGIIEADTNHRRKISTGELTRFLKNAVDRHRFRAGSKEIRIRFAVQVDIAPPSFVLFLNTKAEPTAEFGRFIENRLRETFPLVGTCIRITYRLRGEAAVK